MNNNNKTLNKYHLEQQIQAKERQINDEYTRLGTMTIQLAEASIQRINQLTDEIVALKQLYNTLTNEDNY